MNTMTIRDFRSNIATSFDRVDAGERVLVRRRNKVYTIVPVDDDDLTITPELQAKIDKARQELREGRTVRVCSHEELDALLESL